MKRAAFVLACLLLPLIYVTVFSVLGLIGKVDFGNEIRSMVITSVVSGTLGTIVGFFLGNSDKEVKPK